VQWKTAWHCFLAQTNRVVILSVSEESALPPVQPFVEQDLTRFARNLHKCGRRFFAESTLSEVEGLRMTTYQVVFFL
jgi:hypothetical protein